MVVYTFEWFFTIFIFDNFLYSIININDNLIFNIPFP